MELDKMWYGLLLRVSKSTPLSHTELKALKIDEFFKLLITHTDQQREDKRNGRKNAKN